MIENIDENMGLLMAKLSEWKLDENTVVVFMSDNGMTGGGSGKPGTEVAPGYAFYNAEMKGLKGSTDEGGARVPFFIRWNGKIAAGKDIDRIASHIDVLPTFAALTGATLPDQGIEGRDLLPLIEGSDAEWSDRFLFNHICRWPTGAEPNDFKDANFSVRNQQYRYVGATGPTSNIKGKLNSDAKPRPPGKPSLYDMVADPGQTTDVGAEHPEVVAAMQAAFDQYWKEARPLMVNENATMSPTKPYFEWFAQQQKKGGIPKWSAPEL